MRFPWRNFSLIALNVVGLYLFVRGYLLMRRSLPQSSSCSDYPISTAAEHSSNASAGCWFPKKEQKIIFLVLDALRFDFIWHYDDTKPDGMEPKSTRLSSFQSPLTVLRDLYIEQPDRALLMQAEVDAPTTTMQRLKAMTTGGFPTFIDAGNNFAADKILEDTWVQQLSQSGSDFIFMGDDTWMNLFDHQLFNVTFPYPSFVVHDLHTVDNGVIQSLFEYLSKDFSYFVPSLQRTETFTNASPLISPSAMRTMTPSSSSSYFVIAHMLGIDHAGHRFHARHSAMYDKLQQIDQVLRKLIEIISPDTLLIIAGDHGMTDSGDHGGDTPQETHAGLFFYKKNGLSLMKDTHIYTKKHRLAFIDQQTKLPCEFPPLSSSSCIKMSVPVVSQIDLVPTLSLLAGVPIPYGNLGRLIPHLFDSHEDILTAMRVNARQIQRAIHSYFSETLPFDDLLGIAETHYQQYKRSDIHDSQKPDAIAIYHLYEDYVNRAWQHVHARWTQFDMPLMMTGLLIMVASVLLFTVNLLKYHREGQPLQALSSLSSHPSIPRKHTLRQRTGEKKNSHHEIDGWMDVSPKDRYWMKEPMQISSDGDVRDSWLARMYIGIVLLALPLIHASNSFVVHEDWILLQLLRVGLLFFVSRDRKWEVPVLLAILRFSQHLLPCREYKMDCEEEPSQWLAAVFFRSQPSWWVTVYHLIAIVLFYHINERRSVWFLSSTSIRRSPSLTFTAFSQYVKRWGVRSALAALRWTAYAVVYLYIETSREDSRWASLGGAIFLARFLLLLLVVCSVADRTSVRRNCMLFFVALSGHVTTSVVVAVFYAYFYEHQRKAWRLGKKDTATRSLHSLVVLYLLQHYHFFLNQHVTVFSAIQWKAAFFGLSVPHWLFSGCLVLLNTFSHTVTGFMHVDRQNVDVVVLYSMIITAFSSLFSAHLRRNLFAWKIFAPRFVFQAISHLVTILLYIIYCLFDNTVK